jgi:hypothetical protein
LIMEMGLAVRVFMAKGKWVLLKSASLSELYFPLLALKTKICE